MTINWAQIITSVVGGAILGGVSAFFMLHGRVSNLEGKIDALERAADPARIKELVRGFSADYAKQQPSSNAPPTLKVPTQPDVIKPHEVRILSPTDGADVDYATQVKGKISGKLGTDEHLWLVVHPADFIGWYPQNSEIFPNPDGSWKAGVTIGRENQDHGKQHEIVVVIAPNAAHEAFNEYLRQGYKNMIFPPVALPKNTHMLAKVTVVRR